MPIYRIPLESEVIDGQVIRVEGPGGVISTYEYDAQARSFQRRESQVVIPSFHGTSHVAEDPVPEATADLRGLMSSDDKAKLDGLAQTKFGVLGFCGAGFPDDGGWLTGEVIFAAGSEFVSLEKIGNIIRITVDSPIPLQCVNEDCATIAWIQDESDVSAIRPPSCNGILPGVNAYGELKAYILPEGTILNPANPLPVLNQKVNAPSLIFKRYENTATPGCAQIEMVLQRSNGITSVGWSQTPGTSSALGTAASSQCIWFTGTNSAGEATRFEFKPTTSPGLLGGLLYNGHLITKKQAVVIDYESTVLSTNQYKCRYWSVLGPGPIGNSFVATNIWRYNNPENSPTDIHNPQSLALDASKDLLPIGTLVDLLEFQVGLTGTEPILRRYFIKEPQLGAGSLWALTGSVVFGDLSEAKTEWNNSGSDTTEQVSDIKSIERSIWGITGFEDRLLLATDSLTPDGIAINSAYVADVDTDLPGLKVSESAVGSGSGCAKPERPVYLWHRAHHDNFYAKFLVGMPDNGDYPPLDILLRAPIDTHDDLYMRVTAFGVIGSGIYSGYNYIVVTGVDWKSLPAQGVIRILTDSCVGQVWKYTNKLAFYNPNSVVLINADDVFPGSTGVIVELCHEEYAAPCLRLEFSINNTSDAEQVQMQLRAGFWDPEYPYELDQSAEIDDYIRGFRPGAFSVSRIYTQDGFIHSIETPHSDPEGYVCYAGGFIVPLSVRASTDPDARERWNVLELMYRGYNPAQLWVWWNGLLCPPDSILSAQLPTPVSVSTPYFPISTSLVDSIEPGLIIPPRYGKLGVRCWPGAKIRSVEVRDQNAAFNEYTHGQLEINTGSSGS